MTDSIKYFSRPRFNNPALVVCWESDAGQIGEKITEYINHELKGQAFCEISPEEFFPLGGVVIEKDIVFFPETTFYSFNDRDIVVLFSSIPRFEYHRFLNLIIDVAQDTCHAKEIYTIGGMISMEAHSAPRDAWATFNSIQIKNSLSSYELSREMDFETPPGGRPTLNSFLLWTAKQRGLDGANLWLQIPFYLVDYDDPKAQKRALEFLDSRLDLRLNFARIDAEILHQEERLNRLCQEKPEVGRSIKKLEENEELSEAEHETLVKVIDEYLGKS
jgi:proteasome assembly chaperone (PAC2) family protein